eukprot:COSAG01_NODE_68370_length_264_cov_0.642424_1_plen_22_part_01
MLRFRIDGYLQHDAHVRLLRLH